MLLPPPASTGLSPMSAASSALASDSISPGAMSHGTRRPASARATEPITSSRNPSRPSAGITRSTSRASPARLCGTSDPTNAHTTSRSATPSARRARSRWASDGGWISVSSYPLGATTTRSALTP